MMVVEVSAMPIFIATVVIALATIVIARRRRTKDEHPE
jgi:hypothetical protein